MSLKRLSRSQNNNWKLYFYVTGLCKTDLALMRTLEASSLARRLCLGPFSRSHVARVRACVRACVAVSVPQRIHSEPTFSLEKLESVGGSGVCPAVTSTVSSHIPGFYLFQCLGFFFFYYFVRRTLGPRVTSAFPEDWINSLDLKPQQPKRLERHLVAFCTPILLFYVDVSFPCGTSTNVTSRKIMKILLKGTHRVFEHFNVRRRIWLHTFFINLVKLIIVQSIYP